MSNIGGLSSLRNRYCALRHGHSKANEKGIILSSPKDGVKEEYSLTTLGEQQVRASVMKAQQEKLLSADTVIISSPFSRARRSAEIAREILGAKEAILIDARLRERWFGTWEGTSNVHYEKVWVADKKNPYHTECMIEAAASVQHRVTELILTIECTCKGKTFLLVSHGDALQILQTAFARKSPAVHRSMKHLETAEVRELHLTKL